MKLWDYIPDEHRLKNDQYNSWEQNANIHERIIHGNQVSFIPRMQEYFNIYNSINIIIHMSGLKDKSHITISIDTRKPFTQSNKPSWQRELNTIKAIHEEHTDNIILTHVAFFNADF